MLAAGNIKGNVNVSIYNRFFFKAEMYISLDTKFWSLCLFVLLFCFLSQMIFIIDWKDNIFNDKQTNTILKSTADRNEQVQHNEYMNNDWSS